MARDPYEVLGVSRTSSQDEIKSAYRRLARQHHPDVNPNDPTAEDRFKEIGFAYEILSDPEKRARFDRFGTTEDMPQDPFGGQAGGFGDLFEMFFGAQGGGPRSRSRARNGADIEIRLNLNLLDVLHGKEISLEVDRACACAACGGTGGEGGKQPETCSACNGEGSVYRTTNSFLGQIRTSAPCARCGGTGRVLSQPCGTCRGRRQTIGKKKVEVRIPPGFEDGATMHVGGEGHEGLDGGRPGDLYIHLNVASDKHFEREGQNLYAELEVTYAQAAVGHKTKVQGLEGELDFHVPAGTQPGELISIRGAGLPPLHGGRRGDILVHVRVSVPKRLSDEQRAAILGASQLLGETQPDAEDGAGGLLGFFKKRK